MYPTTSLATSDQGLLNTTCGKNASGRKRSPPFPLIILPPPTKPRFPHLPQLDLALRTGCHAGGLDIVVQVATVHVLLHDKHAGARLKRIVRGNDPRVPESQAACGGEGQGEGCD